MKRARRKQSRNTKRACGIKQDPVAWDSLPTELWVSILRLLDADHVLKMRTVCSYMTHCVDSFKLLASLSATEKEDLYQRLCRTSLCFHAWTWAQTQVQWSAHQIQGKGNLLFRRAAYHGEQALCEWLLHTFQLSLKDVLSDIEDDYLESYEEGFAVLETCAARGHVHMLQWIHKTCPLPRDDIVDVHVMVAAARSGHLEVLQWIHTTFHSTGEDLLANCNAVLCSAIEEGQLNVCQWLYETFHLTLCTLLSTTTLILVFRAGHQAVCEWLYQTGQVRKDELFSIGFGSIPGLVTDGHLDLCKWLYILFPRSVESIRLELLERAARAGHHSICVWLHSVFAFSEEEIKRGSTHHFLGYAACSGSEELCQWFHATFTIQQEDLYKDNLFVLDTAMSEGHATLCQWLYTTYHLSPQDISLLCTEALQTAIKRGHLHVCEWAFALIPEYVQLNKQLLLFTATKSSRLSIGTLLHRVCPYSVAEVERTGMLTTAICLGHTQVALWLCTTFRLQLKSAWFYAHKRYETPSRKQLKKIRAHLQVLSIELVHCGEDSLVYSKLRKRSMK